jgi:hypothetical protein
MTSRNRSFAGISPAAGTEWRFQYVAHAAREQGGYGGAGELIYA